jgi:hypothetical protein
VPLLVVQVPWLAAAVIAVVIAAVPTIAIMLTTPRAGRGASMIRLESEAPIATTHDRALMDIADRVLIIQNGQIEQG